MERAAARARLDHEPDRLAILVFGSIDGRKGLERLAAALAADERLARYVIVVAGTQVPAIRAALTAGPLSRLRSQRRLIVLDRTLDDAEQALVFAAADVVWLGYERHAFMSGVLVLAGRAALPVVATRFGEVGAFVERSEMGLLVNPGGSDEVRTALLALTDETLRRDLGKRSYAATEDHTPQRFKQELVEAIAANAVSSARASSVDEP
jgi:glycosyltransferase involved in cell wall biosynthesis